MSSSPGGPSPKDLSGAAAVARTLAYVVGVAGIVASAAYYQAGGGTIITATIMVFTLAMSGLLMMTGFVLQSLTAILARITAMESDLRVVMGRGSRGDHLGVDDRNERW